MRKLFFVVLVASASVFAFADLGDFKDKVEQTEKEHQKNREQKPAPQPPNDNDASSSKCFLCDLIWSIVDLIWVLNNTTTTFGDYPYAEGGYICWAKPQGLTADGKTAYITTGTRNQWFQLGVQGIWMKDIGFGTWISFKASLYRFFGPYFEDWTIIDGTNSLNGLRLGMTFSLFQSDPFSLSLYGQWNSWSGIINRDGGTLGLEIDSYPIRPISLHARLGLQIFPSFNLGEFEAELGFLVGPAEIFAGWRYWNLVSGGPNGNFEFNGVFSGMRWHF